MNDSAHALSTDGPLVTVEVADPDRPQAEAHAARLLVDTGAELSVIPRDILDALGCPPTREVEIGGVVPGASMRCPVFEVILHVAGAALEVEVAAALRDANSIDGILGRDVLAFLSFTYDGPRGVFTLEAR